MVAGLSWRTDCIRVPYDHSHFLCSPLPFGAICTNLRWRRSVVLWSPRWCADDTQKLSGDEGPWSELRWKSKADLSSKGQKDFICREENGKATWDHAAGPGNWWSAESGWKLGFIAFCVARGWRFWWTMWKEKCLLGVNRCFLGRRRGVFPPS
jgi:hypothetical protein